MRRGVPGATKSRLARRLGLDGNTVGADNPVTAADLLSCASKLADSVHGTSRSGTVSIHATAFRADLASDHYNTHRPHRALRQSPPARHPPPPAEVTGMRVLHRDRLGGLIREYAQIA